jgi:hypothetical protein
MATSQSNPNIPDTSIAKNVDAKSLITTVKELKKVQGDYNDQIKDTVRELNKALTIYGKLEGKLQSLNTSTINIKKIEKEVEKSKANQIVQTNKLKELEKELDTAGIAQAKELLTAEEKIKKLQLEFQRQSLAGTAAERQAALDALNLAEQQFEYLKEYATQTEAAYAAQLKSLDIASQQVEMANDYLDTEKDVEKTIGGIGKILQITSKIGIGKNLYGKIVEEAREGVTITKKWVMVAGSLGIAFAGVAKLASKIGEKLASGLSSVTGTGGPISNLVSPVSNLLKGIPLIGGLLGSVVDMFANLADYATEASSAAQLFGRNLGLSLSEAVKINNEFSDIAHKSGDILFNSRKFREIQTEISDSTGLNNILTADQLKTQVQLKELANIDLDTRKELLEVSRISGVEQSKIVKSIMGQNSVINKTLGVSFQWQKVLKEASSLGGVLGLSFAKYPEKLTKSLVTVKSMGLELKQLDSIADSFLDFESSISKEFEAQLLTGKDINLTKAREAFLNNDLVTAATEITKQVGTSSEFLNMNRIQQDAIAGSIGMTRDSMAEMLKQQENMAKLGTTDLKTYQQRTAELSRTIEGRKELIKTLGEEQAQNVFNQTATEKIASFIDRIKTSFADLLNNPGFKNFIDKIMDWISDPKSIEYMINKLTDFSSLIIKSIAVLLDGIDSIPGISVDPDVRKKLHDYATSVGSLSIGSLAATSEARPNNTNTMQSPNSSMPVKNNESKSSMSRTITVITGNHVDNSVQFTPWAENLKQ